MFASGAVNKTVGPGWLLRETSLFDFELALERESCASELFLLTLGSDRRLRMDFDDCIALSPAVVGRFCV